ncbi:hypothetical protein LTR15_012814 [Elasticomyces elasticus]|nr:hypothetical protein LTR15_012814 [Elasticomyces elasticus]
MLRFLIPDALSGNVIVTSERVRQQHLDVVYADLQRRLAECEKVSCIVTGLVNDKLSLPESHGVCKALLQAAPDSTASSIYMGIAWLCSQDGRTYQTELYAAIMAAYHGDRDKAWDMAFREEIVPLIVSFYKETLRFWTTTPFATPRATVSDIKHRDIWIPKGVTMIMNAQQGNHDESWYGHTAGSFDPTRFMSNETSLPHLTYGAGSRICPSAALSNRIIYAMIVRLILAFEMAESEEPNARRPNLDPINFSGVRDSLVALPRAYDCCYGARDAEWLVQKW